MNEWLSEQIRAASVKPAVDALGPPPQVADTSLTGFTNATLPLIRASYILQKTGDGAAFLEEAAACAAAACEQYPTNIEAWDALGSALRAQNRTDEALEAYAQGHDLEPSNLRVRANMGSALIDAGFVVDGVMLLEGVLKERPNFAYAFLCLARGVFLLGDLERAWMLYSQRRRIPNFAVQVCKYPVPMWDGKRRERVILVGEEGAGEKLMFASMVPEMQARGAEVIFEANKSFARFAPLIRRSFPDVEVAIEETLSVGIQSQILGGDLPGIFRPSFNHFPKHSGYLKADPARVQYFKDYFYKFFGTKKVVGFSWRGGDALARYKGLPLADFDPLLRTPGVAFVDIQFGPHDKERALAAGMSLPVPHRIPNLDTWNDMDGLAACMQACDEIITVSNTNSHIAGALGKKTTTIIPSQAGAMWFHFGKEHDISPWYPSMRLIRHKWGNDLSVLNADLISQVSTGLAERAA